MLGPRGALGVEVLEVVLDVVTTDVTVERAVETAVETEVDVAVEVEVTVDVTVEGAEGALTETATYPTAPTMTISTIIIAAITARATPNLFGLRFNCIFFLNLFNNRLAPHLSCHRFHNF